MKKVLFLLSLIFLGVFAKSQNFGQFGSAALIKTQTGDQYYNFTGDSGNQIGTTSFSGSLGTYNQNSGGLILKGAQLKTWKEYTANVCGGSLYYVIYPTGNRPLNPTFTPMILSYKDGCSGSSFPSGGQCGNPRDQKWANENSAIDLTSYAANNYTLEIYLQYTGSNTSGNGCETTQYISNYGNNYSMTFTVSPPDINSFKNSGSLPAITPSSTAITGTENYIQTTDYLTADQSQKNINITYFDGLGRPKQQIAVAASPSGNDIVTPIEYDAFDRQTKNWLPLPQTTSTNAAYIPSVDNSTASSIYGNSLLYSEKKLEASPLDRLKEQGHPGTDWAIGSGHTQKFDYDSNTASDVKRFKATTQWNATNLDFDETLTLAPDDSDTTGGFFNAATLYKNSVTDEDGNISTEFKNGQGQTLLVRKNDGTNNIDTYYVYDDFDNLAYVIPPLAWSTVLPSAGASADQTILDNLCYQYKYDNQNRLAEKKLPGKGGESMIYDLQDRLVATQDANLKLQSQWLFTKYDQYGRIVYTGITLGSDRGTEQGTLDGMGSNNEARSTTFFTKNGMDVYYTSSAYPTSFTTLLSVNYYDDYSKIIPAASIPTAIQTQAVITATPSVSGTNTNTSVSTRGLPVASFVKDVEDDSWTKTFTWFDIKGRAIGTSETNHLGGFTKTESLLDFKGVSRLINTSHARTANDNPIQISETFTFDTQYRPLKHYHAVGNNQSELLSNNTYNEAGQLTNKQVGNNLQSIDYKYNIRGWMTGINDPNNLGTSLFAMALRYNEPIQGLSVPDVIDYPNDKVLPRYNGNISEITWLTATTQNDPKRTYGYVYDGLNRLKGGYYQNATNPSANEYLEHLTYDVNGNIQSLKRTAQVVFPTPTAEVIDNLSYTYDVNGTYGNQLMRVFDLSANTKGFKDDVVPGNYDSTDDYAYDSNGNMTRDDNKGITKIEYNFLNLPNQINLPNNNFDHYTYNSEGVKLRKVNNIFIGNSTAYDTTDYLDGFQYHEYSSISSTIPVALQFFPTTEGYYDYTNKRYVYNYTDQSGNVRLSYYKGNNSLPIIDKETNYYPFGMEHDGYNLVNSANPNYLYSFQHQEKQIETGWDSFKWRNYDPTIGRFFNVDILAEKYPYNSTFAFQENKIGMGRELEGMEILTWEDIRQAASQTGDPEIADAVIVGGLIVLGAEWSWDSLMKGMSVPAVPGGLGIPGYDPINKTYRAPNQNSEARSKSSAQQNTRKTKSTSEDNSKNSSSEDGNNKPTRNERMRQKKEQKSGNGRGNSSEKSNESSEHTKNARKSTQQKHEEGQARKARDSGGEKKDTKMKYKR